MAFFVKERKRCTACTNGVITNPCWQELWEWYMAAEAATGEKPSEEEMQKYIREHYMESEPEEIACPECEGEGFIEREVELSAALKILGYRK